MISNQKQKWLATLLTCLCLLLSPSLDAQELNCTVKIIHSQIQGTNKSVFETLETAIREFMNNRAWTDLQFQKVEKIDCTMNITLKKYNEAENAFSGEMIVQLSRPIYNSSYSSTIFSTKDDNFSFTYKEYDNLEFNENNLDNELTALLAYYAYLFIGFDLDTFSPLGGTEVLHRVENIANSASTSFGNAGWRAFSNEKNRHAIINDYMDGSMEGYRQLQYKYHRLGLDEMSNNAERGRIAVTEAIEALKEVHSNKPLSQLPIIFTDFKRDEIVNIYSGHGTEKEKQTVYDILNNLNASQTMYWDKMKK